MQIVDCRIPGEVIPVGRCFSCPAQPDQANGRTPPTLVCFIRPSCITPVVAPKFFIFSLISPSIPTFPAQPRLVELGTSPFGHDGGFGTATHAASLSSGRQLPSTTRSATFILSSLLHRRTRTQSHLFVPVDVGAKGRRMRIQTRLLVFDSGLFMSRACGLRFAFPTICELGTWGARNVVEDGGLNALQE